MLINFEISATDLRPDKTVVEAFLIVPTLLRGNAASDALRHASLERCKRGNDVLSGIPHPPFILLNYFYVHIFQQVNV